MDTRTYALAQRDTNAHPAQQVTFEEYVKAVEEPTLRVIRITEHIHDLVQSWRWQPVVEALQALRSCAFYWPAFSARAVEFDRPLLSPTGYRSFLGVQGDPVPGLNPEEFTRRVIESYIANDLKGRLVPIEPKYRQSAGA